MLWIRTLAVSLVGVVFASAETRDLIDHPRPGARPSKLWRLSVAALAAGSAADAWNSYGRPELNPLLRSPGGIFSARGIGIKAAVAGGGVAAQWLVLRRRPDAARAAAITNFGVAGLFTGVAVRNRILTPPPSLR